MFFFLLLWWWEKGGRGGGPTRQSAECIYCLVFVLSAVRRSRYWGPCSHCLVFFKANFPKEKIKISPTFQKKSFQYFFEEVLKKDSKMPEGIYGVFLCSFSILTWMLPYRLYIQIKFQHLLSERLRLWA